MQCNDECCENKEGKRKGKPNRLSAVKDMKENFGKLDHLIDAVKNLPKHEPDDSQHYNTENTEEGRKVENVIENIKTNIKNLGVGFKQKELPKHHNNLDKLNDKSENEHFSATTFNKTEQPSLGEEDNDGHNHKHTNAHDHDMIDDDQELSNSDEYSLRQKGISEDDQEENKEDEDNGTEPSDQLENDSLVNDEKDQESSMHDEEDEDTDDTNHDMNEPSDDISEPGDNKSTARNEDDISDENPEETDSESNDRVFSSMDDSSKDPMDELLDEEGIDDFGKFGKKRNIVLTKKSSS